MKTKTLEPDGMPFEILMKLDLMSFVHRCFLELNPGQELSRAPYLEVMAAKLAACLTGRGPKRIILCLPPRSLKSITVSVAAVAWMLGHDPTKQIIGASYGQDLADKHARDTRNIMTSSFYRKVFPGTQLSPQKLSVNDFMTTEQGFRMGTSVTGVLTGRGGDILIIDDPLKPEDALSDTKRSSVNEWYDSTLLSRLNNKKDGIIIIVMQRLHQDDLVGHVLERGEDWEVISFAAIAEENTVHTYETVRGSSIYKRQIGDVLNPDRESFASLLSTKELVGTFTFSSQYQQNPTPVGGAMVKTDWLMYYDPLAPMKRFSVICQSWDTANKGGELNDYSVCTTWGLCDGRYYLLDVFRKRLNYPELKAEVQNQIKKHNSQIVLIEDKGSGTQLIQELRILSGCKVRAYAPPSQMDKVMRMFAQTAKFESGKVHLPNDATWLEEYRRELTAFPGSKFDDQVDSTTQALDYLSSFTNSLEVWRKLGSQP
jgi:predicted phage terminase large subunit-like protein